jgi:uncharacterized protein
MSILKRNIKVFYDSFISLKGEPKNIAMGLAIGVFVGVTPTIPFHTAIIIFAGLLFRNNLTSAYLGSWLISNPITIPLFYLSQYELGRLLLGMNSTQCVIEDYSVSCLLKLGWQIVIPLFTGGIIMAPFFAIPAYFIARRLLVSVRKNAKR